MTQAEAMLSAGFESHLAIHGESASFTPAGGIASTILVIFDEAAEVADPESGILTTRPQARVRSSDVPLPNDGRLDVRGITYNVLLAREDGLGNTYMTLSRNKQVPLAPCQLSVEIVGGNAVLTWVRSATNNTGVEVWSAVEIGSGFTRIATLAADVQTYADSGVTRLYKVRNTNKSGPSAFSYIFNTMLGALIDESGALVTDDSGSAIGTQ